MLHNVPAYSFWKSMRKLQHPADQSCNFITHSLTRSVTVFRVYRAGPLWSSQKMKGTRVSGALWLCRLLNMWLTHTHTHTQRALALINHSTVCVLYLRDKSTGNIGLRVWKLIFFSITLYRNHIFTISIIILYFDVLKIIYCHTVGTYFDISNINHVLVSVF